MKVGRVRSARERVVVFPGGLLTLVSVAEKHTVRDGIIAGTIAAVLGSLLLDPVGTFLGAVWHVITRGAIAVWHGVTASVPIPVWVLLLVAGAIVALIARRRRGGERRPVVVEPGIGDALVEAAATAVAPPMLTELEDKIIRIMARADGSPLRLGQLATLTGATQLRVEQAIEGLTDRHRLVHRYHTVMDGTSYGLTTRGRDFVISRGDA